MKFFLVIFSCFLSVQTAVASELEGTYLYKITTLQAAPGELTDVIKSLQSLISEGHYDDTGTRKPMIMRHSQGDHWDLLILKPVESYSHYYSPKHLQARKSLPYQSRINALSDRLAFEDSFFAYGPSADRIEQAFAENAFFHLELFEAAPSSKEKLLTQRRMENLYLQKTHRKPNFIFSTADGSNIDSFTIGFHKNLLAYATRPEISDEDADIAARSAGFKDRSDIGILLRHYISSHHDTFATKVE
jgi:hypothetical protein